jgi:hypothetical protein
MIHKNYHWEEERIQLALIAGNGLFTYVQTVEKACRTFSINLE